jgi:hypothetical protein
MSVTSVYCRLRAVPPNLLSAGLDFRACERKGGTADNTSRNEIRVTLPTQRKIPIGRNRYACQSNLIRINYAINNFQTECWFYKQTWHRRFLLDRFNWIYCLVPRRLFVKKTAMRIWRVYMKYCSGERWAKGLMGRVRASPAYLNTSCIVII